MPEAGFADVNEEQQQRFARTFGSRIVFLASDGLVRAEVGAILSPVYHVEAVLNGAEALEAARRDRPDLILCDVGSPQIHGLTLLKTMRADELLRDIPFILLSDLADEQAWVDAMEAGADEYLVRPISERRLRVRVGSLLELTRTRRENEERFRTFMSATSHAVYRMSADWKEMRFLQGRDFIPDTQGPNPTWLETYIHPADQPEVMAAIGEAIRTQSIFQLEHRVRRVDGTLGWTFSKAIPLKDTAGRVIEWLGTASDVSERKYFEQSLQERSNELRQTLETAAIGLTRLDRNLRYVTANAAYARVAGLPLDRIIGHTMEEVLGAEAFAKVRPYITRVLDGETVDYEALLPWAAAGPRWIHATYTPWRDAAGTVSGWVASIADITERKQAEEALAASEARFRTAIEATRDILWTNDPNGRITEQQPGWSALTGQSYEEYKGYGWAKAVHPEDAQPTIDAWEAAVATRSKFVFEHRVRRHDGQWRTFSVKALPVYNSDGVLREWVGVHTDVTDIRDANAALREADRRKDEFLATLAHELRNPLSPVRNAALILQNKAADASARELAVAIIQRQVQGMALLLDELLDISRITRGSLTLQIQRVSLKAVLDNAVEIARPMIAARRHHLDIRLPPAAVEIDVDPLRFSQAVANLLTNAAKYTDAGGHIEVRASLDDHGVTIAVKDSGIGLEPESLSGIFAMFSQVKSALSRSEGGLGIGLALVKGLVELHGGTVSVSSDGLGQGSEFRVHLPQHLSWLQEQPKVPADTRSSLTPPRRVLIADDNKDAASTLSLLLELDGHEVNVVHDGRGALEAAQRLQPELAIIDIGMPQLNGYEVARAIRNEEWGTTIRLIALTGWGQEEDKRRAYAAGFDAHLTKPVDPEELQVQLTIVGTPTATRA